MYIINIHVIASFAKDFNVWDVVQFVHILNKLMLGLWPWTGSMYTLLLSVVMHNTGKQGLLNNNILLKANLKERNFWGHLRVFRERHLSNYEWGGLAVSDDDDTDEQSFIRCYSWMFQSF